MLRLAGERPGIETRLLGLALEANDDSEREFQRLLALVDNHSAAPAWDELGVSVHQQRNSVKIFPAVARQLGELEVSMVTRFYDSAPASLAKSLNGQHLERGRSRRRRYERARTRGQRPTTDQATLKTDDPDLLAARYQAHETCLSAFDGLFAASLERWEGDYDLLVIGDEEVLLIEVKTVRVMRTIK